jgi:hypothetical protein
MNPSKQLTFVVPFHNFDHNHNSFRDLAHKLSSEQIIVRLVCDSLNNDNYETLSFFISSLSEMNCKWELIRGNYGSAGAARNAGLKNLQTKWVAFLDCDDDAYITSYIRLCSECEDPDIDLIIGQILLRDQASGRISKETRTQDLLNVAQYPAFTRVIYRTQAIQGLLFPLFPLGEDQLFLASAVLRARKITFSDIPLYIYSVNRQEQTTSKKIDINVLQLSLKELSRLGSTKSPERRSFLRLVQVRMGLSVLKRVRPATFHLYPATFMRIVSILVFSPRLFFKLNSGLNDVKN